MRLALLALSGCVASLHVTDRARPSDEAAAFALTAQDGRSVDLATELAHGPVVLVFYRGFW